MVKKRKPQPRPVGRTKTAGDVPKNPELLPDKVAAPYIALRPQTLAKWRCEGHPEQPPYIRIGRLIFYRKAELDKWLAARTVVPD